jgi:acyl-CoA dehydrogenase
MTILEGQETGRNALEAWRVEAAGNAFDRDAHFRALLDRHLGPDPARDRRLARLAERAGAELDALVTEDGRDEHLPVVRRHDRFGRAVEEVVFHPAHDEIGRVFWGSEVLAVLRDPGNERLAGAIAYLLDRHGEAGHACPVACTAGAIKLLQKLGTDDQKAVYLPALLEPDYDRRLHAAQFVTEVQGGSDVGLNACVAVPDGERAGWYRLSGEKWFCSVADANLFVVSARLEGAAAGTRGLGLFLVPRTIDGQPNGFVLRRLKWKLGTRSMATGEIELDGALGEPIGSVHEGFRNLVAIVLDTSRVHNALAACGIMARAFDDARAFARHRVAFEHPIIEFPAVQETLARMRLRLMTGLGSTFRILAMTDAIDTGAGDDTVVAARRIGVMVNKYWTAINATSSARDGIEVLGGNGTIEDFSAMPRLYRDAIVVESWEGTHNTLCAQIQRDFASRGLHRPWLEHTQAEVEALAHPGLVAAAATARELLDDVRTRIERMLAAPELEAAARIRHVIDRMARLTDWVALAAQRQWELEQEVEGVTAAALELYRVSRFEHGDPEERPEMIALHRELATAP